MTRKEKKFESKPWITHGLKLYRKWIKTESIPIPLPNLNHIEIK
jgi:hypothetical protein